MEIEVPLGALWFPASRLLVYRKSVRKYDNMRLQQHADIALETDGYFDDEAGFWSGRWPREFRATKSRWGFPNDTKMTFTKAGFRLALMNVQPESFGLR